MKIEIPQIFWHGNNDRVMSIDFYPHTNYLVTCGAESEDKMWVKLWDLTQYTPPAQTVPEPQVSTASDLQPQNQDKIPIIQNSDNSEEITTCLRPVFIAELTGAHTATVNIARFSPNGMYLATAGDDRTIVIWVQKSKPVSFGSSEEKVSWCNAKIMRGHLSDVYDISWSPDSQYLISGSVDNSAIVWSIEKGKGIQKFTDHNHFVQGVSWDPRNKYIVTQSSDKSVRFYKNAFSKQDMKFYYLNQMKRFEKAKNVCDQQKEKINKSQEDLDPNKADKMIIDEEEKPNSNEKDKDVEMANPNNMTPSKNLTTHYYFADEAQCPSFVRRLSWSPDGSICLLVSGITKSQTSNELNFVVWGMSRKDFSHPLFYIPTLDKSSVCVRFCPILFKKENKLEENKDSPPALLDLPYVMVFAIATIDSVYIYGTDSINPRFAITNIHYQALTDLAWNGDSILAISSSDGYISFCSFEKGELGIPLKPEEIVNDEKLKTAYEMYLNIDINKNIQQNTMITSIIKPKKKKEETTSNINNPNNINVNNNISLNNIVS